MVLIGIAVVTLLLVLYWRVLKWLKKRQAAPMERGLMENTSATPQGISAPAHVARLDDLRKKFEQGVQKFAAAGKSLYSFPWYLIVGEPGSGKTEAVRHCNVGFPPGLQDEYQGAGGTLNMNWWFTDHAVILDTAGRLMFEEVETGGSSEWKEFLSLMRRYRTRCPINGVLLVIPADSLIKDTADEIERKASKIARQFDLIQRALDVRFPVFVVITKSDLINGFRDFFDNLQDPQLQHQILGWSNPAPLDEPYNPDFIDQHLKTIQGRLYRRRLALIQEVTSEESGIDKVRAIDTLYAFPLSITKIAPRLARYLELIFSVGSQWSCKPLFFRGIYFTSSMREGSALDEDLAESLGVPVDSLPDGRVWERDRAYFLRDLFTKKVFREQGLVTYATNAKKLHSRRKTAVLISAAASVALLLLFTIYAANRFSRSIGKMEGYFANAARFVGPTGQNELEIIKKEGENNYRYIGRTKIYDKANKPIPDVMRLNFSAGLADTVLQWEKEGVPWIFALAARVAEGIEPEKLRKAEAVVYEKGVLHPLLNAARDLMDTQTNGRWTREDNETRLLRHLIRIRAGKSFDEDGEYSPEVFLDPFVRYIFAHDELGGYEEDLVKQIKLYDEDKARLHYPLRLVYGTSWPAESFKSDPNDRDVAIEHGADLFNKYWKDPNRISQARQDSTQIKTLNSLRGAISRFNSAEEAILLLGGRGSDGPHALSQLKSSNSRWDEAVKNLSEARRSIVEYSRTLEDSRSLGSLWSTVSTEALKDVNENYEFLLDELKEVRKGEFLGEIRDELEMTRSEIIASLSNSDLTRELDQLDRGFWTQRNGRRLYEIRFEMYKNADEQVRVARHLSELNQVAGAVNEVNRAIKAARDKIRELGALDPGAFRLQQAHDVSMSVLDGAEQRQLSDVLKGGLVEAAPKNMEELAKLIEKGGGMDWPATVPTKIVDKKYDPSAAAAVLEGWVILGDVLRDASKKYELLDETHLNELYRDANGVYVEYVRRYVNYWLQTVPDHFIRSIIPQENQWQAQHLQLRKLDVLDVSAQLNKFGKDIEENALGRFEKYIPAGEQKVRQFRKDMGKLADNFFQKRCERTLEKWGSLSGEAFEARNELLSNNPILVGKDYLAFSAGSPTEFVEAYWTELTHYSLRLIADQVQREGEEAFENLRARYGSKFPLERDSTQDLTLAELKDALSLSKRALPRKQYDPGTIGAGAETGVANVDKQFGQMRALVLPQSSSTWAEGIRQVLQGIPESVDPYYCRITLLSESQQRELLRQGEELLLDYLTEFRLLQGSGKSGRFSTRSRENHSMGMVKYPGPSVTVEFFQYPSDAEARTSLEFPGPWASLRMLHQCSDECKKGYIKLNVKTKEGLGGVFCLQLEFFKDSDGTNKLDLPRPDQWPSLKK
ncbi:MAG TPA: type VI secretion protein IcmF/TssM N-terminal domain-containing protein [Sedimentisphaerales bacterium]|nr:type VI secretion protein IcmF/TssM N-terminal domain-containing protein [Sedimentisphaerales bacterium]